MGFYYLLVLQKNKIM